MVDFLSDPDIPNTILGDSSNPTLRGYHIPAFVVLILHKTVLILKIQTILRMVVANLGLVEVVNKQPNVKT